MILPLLSFNIVSEHLTNIVRQEKKLRNMKIRKKETKPLSYTDSMIVHKVPNTIQKNKNKTNI